MPSQRHFMIWIFLSGITIPVSDGMAAENFPTRPLRIVTSGLGGGADFAARLIAQGISGPLGQSVIVDNRASGFIPGETVAKARPGDLNYSSGGTGSSSHLAAELFKYMAGVKIVRIPYKSGSQETNDLISGQVQMTFSTPASVMQHVKSGKLKALAVTSLQPSTLVPGLPAIAASLPGYESISIHGMFAPSKTPEAIIKRLNQEIVRFLNTAEVKERFFGVGVEIVGSSPEELAAKVKSDMARMGKVIKDAGIRNQ